MRVRATSPLFEHVEAAASVTTHHPRACYGQAVLVLQGDEWGAVGPLEAEFAGFEVLEATDDEVRQLMAAGYRLKGLGYDPAALVQHA